MPAERASLVSRLSLILAIAAVIAFIWAVRSGQMDDLDTPGSRPLIDRR